MTDAPFLMSVESTHGNATVHGFHLGTIESIARQIVEEKFHAMLRNNMPVRTIALIRNRRIVDVYSGEWESVWDCYDDFA